MLIIRKIYFDWFDCYVENCKQQIEIDNIS